MAVFSSFLSWYYLAAGCYAGSLLFFLIKWQRTALALLSFGVAAHSAALLCRGFSFGIFAPLNLFTELYLLPWLVGVFTLARCLALGNTAKDLHLLILQSSLTFFHSPCRPRPEQQLYGVSG